MKSPAMRVTFGVLTSPFARSVLAEACQAEGLLFAMVAVPRLAYGATDRVSGQKLLLRRPRLSSSSYKRSHLAGA